MTPGQIAALTAVADILQRVGTWKTGSLIALVAFMPDIIFVLIIVFQSSRQDKTLSEMKRQHDDFAQKYENNVELVKQVTRIAEGLQDVVVLNTQTLQGVKESVDKNIYCPLMRKDPKVEKPL